ncbi:hypothetical protein ACFS6H_07690 [Terrimonas rubra]|uniref:GNAT family N-acetyltransferase n=1 Tax=Terrimonas rubra TaxID=1035890 RepID=A0ABW6A5N7_9BACT
MPNIEITKADAEIIQDILEWAFETSQEKFSPDWYRHIRKSEITNGEFVHYMNFI